LTKEVSAFWQGNFRAKGRQRWKIIVTALCCLKGTIIADKKENRRKKNDT